MVELNTCNMLNTCICMIQFLYVLMQENMCTCAARSTLILSLESFGIGLGSCDDWDRSNFK